MTGKRLNGLDIAFLRLDSLASPMNIGTLGIFEPSRAVPMADLVAILGQRLGSVPRFRQRVRSVRFPPGALEWTEDARFQVEAHVRASYLPSPGDHGLLNEYVAQTLAHRLDPSRPLWEVHVIGGLPDDKFALLVKTHHALADGLGVPYLIGAMMDGMPALPEPRPDERSPRVLAALRTVAQPDQWLTMPTAIASQLAARVTDSARQATRGLGVVTSVLRKMRVAPHSPLLGPPARTSLRRRLTTASLDRKQVRRVCEAHQVSTNDVLLAVLTGALRRWLEARGHPVNEVSPRALVPVDLHGYHKTAVPGNGNELSGYLCDLPVSERDPVRRLRSLHTSMKHNKANGPYRGPGAVAMLAGVMPDAVQPLLTPLAGQSARMLFDMVVTSFDIPGGKWPVAGAPMREAYGVAPLAKGHGLSVALSKMEDSIGVALYSDPSILPDAALLGEAVPKALAELAPIVPVQRTEQFVRRELKPESSPEQTGAARPGAKKPGNPPPTT